MKILNFVYLGYADAPNGAATFFRTFIENRNKFNSERCVTRFYCQNLTQVFHDNNVSNNGKMRHSIFLRRLILSYSRYSIILTLVVFYLFILRHAQRVVSQIKDVGENDQWIFNDPFVCYFFLQKYSCVNNKTLIFHNDGDLTKMLFVNFPKLKCKYIKKIIEHKENLLLRHLDNIVLLSENALKVATRKYSILNLKSKYFVVSNGAELPYKFRQRKEDGKLIGVSVGTIGIRKGFDLLVGACEKLNIDSNRIHIYCIGNIQDNSIIESSKNLDNISFLGALSQEYIAQVLADADFFILCSRDEGMPISIIEAMQYSLPIMATNVGAIDLMFENGKEGILMYPSVESIYDTLQSINNSKYSLKEMGKEARRHYETCFTIESMIEKYKKLLNV